MSTTEPKRPTPESWGVHFVEFARGNTAYRRSRAIDRRREEIVATAMAERGEKSLEELRLDLLGIGGAGRATSALVKSGAAVPSIVDAALKAFVDSVAAGLRAAASVSHASAMWAVFTEAGVHRVRAASGRRGRVRLQRLPGRAQWSRVPSTGQDVRNLGSLREEVLKFIEGRLNLTDEDFERLRERYGAYAQALAEGIVNGRNRRRLEQALAEIIREDLHVDAAKRVLAKALDELGLSVKRPASIETVVRTQVQVAYSAGAVQADRDPAVAEILWGYTYATVGDDRVRPKHQGLDGVTLPKDHPRWSEIMPPNSWNCRCTVLRVFEPTSIVEPPQQTNIEGETVTPGADQGFKFNPGDLFQTILDVDRGAIA